MALSTIEELANLTQEEALRSHLNERNYERLRWVGLGLAVVAFLASLAYLFASSWLQLVAPIAILATTRSIYTAERWFLRRRSAQPVLVLCLLLLLTATSFLPGEFVLGLTILGYLGPLLAVAFFLNAVCSSILLLLILIPNIVWDLVQMIKGGEMALAPRPVLLTVVTLLAFYFSRTATQRATETFNRWFRIETSRMKERRRMKSELASARQIQLSMLPSQDPRIAGLDISAVSLPATEVGGDYYDYFYDGTERVALVIGDVAGHGVASGLLLSGIRSCLYLLDPDRPQPNELLSRLDRMVMQTTDRRMFITLLYAVLDQNSDKLTFSTAGHPAPLHYRVADRSVVELSAPAPPLGTRLKPEFRSFETPFRRGDVFLFYSDGLTEIRDRRGDLYGDQRLAKRLERSAEGKDARAIREAVLGDVWTFKGDEEQHDDITLMVVRVTS